MLLFLAVLPVNHRVPSHVWILGKPSNISIQARPMEDLGHTYTEGNSHASLGHTQEALFIWNSNLTESPVLPFGGSDKSPLWSTFLLVVLILYRRLRAPVWGGPDSQSILQIGKLSPR